MTKYIFVIGGVISGLGKGVTTGSIGATLREMGYNKINIKKLDPYLNVDPGTMNPVEHGEVYVTHDGGETDLDLGYYERIADVNVSKKNSISSGKLFWNLLKKERKGEFLGKTVQLIPHFTDSIKNFIKEDEDKYDFVICEIGGSTGDYEALPFLEAVRQIKQEDEKNVMVCFLSYLVYYQASKELKSKPTQVAIKQLMSYGIKPDLLFARAEHEVSKNLKSKLSKLISINVDNIITAMNVPTIYQVPLEYKKEGLVKCLSTYFKLKMKKEPPFTKWVKLNKIISESKEIVKIGVVGKYVELEDSYYSVIEALNSAGWANNVKVSLTWINARNKGEMIDKINDVDGVLVPGGFGTSGIEEIIAAIKYCRENLVPFMGICLGMQLSTIEFARNILGIKNASSREFGKPSDEFIVDLMKEWKRESGVVEKRGKDEDLGGTLRLGSYDTVVSKGTLAHKLYQKTNFKERHRHRYEVNIKYKKRMEEKGFIFSGLSPDGKLPEIIEIREYIQNGKKIKHPFFIAGQFHPEFNSSPFKAHPMFQGLVKAAKINKKN